MSTHHLRRACHQPFPRQVLWPSEQCSHAPSIVRGPSPPLPTPLPAARSPPHHCWILELLTLLPCGLTSAGGPSHSPWWSHHHHQKRYDLPFLIVHLLYWSLFSLHILVQFCMYTRYERPGSIPNQSNLSGYLVMFIVFSCKYWGWSHIRIPSENKYREICQVVRQFQLWMQGHVPIPIQFERKKHFCIIEVFMVWTGMTHGRTGYEGHDRMARVNLDTAQLRASQAILSKTLPLLLYLESHLF
jgi:hypothetical protein